MSNNVHKIKSPMWWRSLPFEVQKEILIHINDMHSIVSDIDSAVLRTAKEFGLGIDEAKYAYKIFTTKVLKNPRIRHKHFPGKHLGKNIRAIEEYRKRILEDLDFMDRAIERARAHTGTIPVQLKTAVKKMLKKLNTVNKTIMQYQAGFRSNPPAPAVEIYDTILAIEAIKGNDSLWPKEQFRHDFEPKSKAKVYGLSDGSLLIKSDKGKKLWKNFDGYKKGLDY